MVKCPHFEVCPISNEWLATSPEVIDVMLSNFCDDSFTNCAVYRDRFDEGVEAHKTKRKVVTS